MTRGSCICVGVFLLLVAGINAATAEAKRILLLHSFGREFSPYREYSAKLRTELRRQAPQPIDIYEASVETARFTEGERENPFIEYLDALFGGRQVDLVITIGAPATGFVQRHRQRVFPSAPVLFSAVEQRLLDGALLTANDAFVAVKIEAPTAIESILALLPDTRRIAVVTGNSPLEQFWLAERRREFRRFTDRIEFTWFNEFSLAEILRRVGTLPPHSAVYLGHLSVDAAGVPHEDDKALAAIHAVANAPIFSYVDAHFGRGIVGGPMISLGDVSRQAAAVAMRILGGETPGTIKTAPLGFAAPVFDWRELQRWRISEASLPLGSTVQFRDPTVWEQYRWYIVLGALLFTLEAIFIVALLVSRRRLNRAHAERRRAEEAAHELSGRLITATEQERSRLARELHDDVTQRLAALAIDAGREEQRSADSRGGAVLRSIRDNLVRLSEDVHALSYRLHPSIVEDLGLVVALKSECERVSQSCPVRLDADLGNVPEKLPRDVALCLFRIAQQGLNNVTRHAKASRVEVCLRRADGGLQLAVKDDGIGFDSARHRDRPSIGHGSMRQRVHLLGGNIEIDSSPGRGTSIVAWVPLREQDIESPACAAG